MRGVVAAMARTNPNPMMSRERKQAPAARTAGQTNGAQRHEHRTAKVVELIGSSRSSFDDAIRNALKDAAQTTRGITGVDVANMSLKCDNGRILEYKVNLRIAFGIERTQSP